MRKAGKNYVPLFVPFLYPQNEQSVISIADQQGLNNMYCSVWLLSYANTPGLFVISE